MFDTLINSLRDILGVPTFYLESGAFDYGAALEYVVCSLLLLIVVSSVFKILRYWICK